MMKDEMQQRVDYLDKVIRKAERMIRKSPPGRLRVSGSKSTQYYQVSEDAPGSGKYLKKNDPLIGQLAQKDYCRQVMKAAKKERDALIRGAEAIPEICAEECYGCLSEERKRFVKPLIETDEAYVSRWKAVEYMGKPFREGDSFFITDNGERVRSKSELIIANTLKRMEIPYRYEYPLKLLDGRVIYPDFLALNVRKKKEMVWEHFGMMDDGDYSEKAVRKIRSFHQAGIFPGDRLIMTFETSKQPLDTFELKSVIQTYLQ